MLKYFFWVLFWVAISGAMLMAYNKTPDIYDVCGEQWKKGMRCVL